jgi:threonyl-tRNA synthetase
MRSEQRLRGFTEVITPNMFRSEIFKTSAHYWTYPERYSLDNEGEEWMLKPMNCPGHCAVFRHRVRSYKELPLRLSDFGVLHRKEPSGSLSGLTRVRRFVQDDGHIFCRPDQVAKELSGALDFMKYVYSQLGLKYSFVLSTRPKKAIGSRVLWDNAECSLAKALNQAGVGWKLNKGDGAFYGPKIDILIEDAAGKSIQCATIQLDFQLPLRFNLQYEDRQSAAASAAECADARVNAAEEQGPQVTEEAAKKTSAERREQQLRDHGIEGPLKPGFVRPVMIHRAVFGSLERFSAILTEHFAGKWPFFLNPRQVMVVPVHPKHNEYSDYVASQMFKVGGIYADSNTDTGGNMKKKIAQAISLRYSFIAVVGDDDSQKLTVTMRARDDSEARLLMYCPEETWEDRLVFPLAESIKRLRRLNMPCSQDLERFDLWNGLDPADVNAAAAAHSCSS